MTQVDPYPTISTNAELSVKPHILIVGAGANIYQAFATPLTKQNYQIDWVGSGDEALEKLASTPISLIVLNSRLPTRSGYDFCGMLKGDEQFRLIPVIFFSDTPEPLDKNRLYQVGGADFISYPLHEGEILARITTQLALERTRQQLQDRTAQLADEAAERKTVVKALEESEERFRIIASISNDGLYDWNVLTNEMWGNEEFMRRFVIPAPSEIDDNWYNSLHPDDRDMVVEAFDDASNGQGMNWQLEYRYQYRDGEYRWLKDNAHFVRDINGTLIRVLGAITDIHDHKQTLAALARSEAKYRNILDTIQEAYYENDLEGNLLFFNQAGIDLLGYSPEEMLGMNYRHYTDQATGQKLAAVGQQVIQTGSPVTAFDWRVIRKDGTERFISMSISLERDADGQPTGLHGISRDVTELKKAEEQQLQLAMERERVKILTNFIEKASHEFRTPLSILQTNIYLLSKTVQQERAQQRLAQMKERIVNLTGLIDDLVMMTRLDRDTDFSQGSVQIPSLIEEVVSTLQPTIDEAEVSLQTVVEADLPVLTGDSSYLHIALKNIMSNAIRYTPENGAITISIYRNTTDLIIAVQDTGIGMTADQIARIFERFYRVDVAHSTQGFGLGLPIAKKIIETHQGQIEVESALEQGSIFTIILPL